LEAFGARERKQKRSRLKAKEEKKQQSISNSKYRMTAKNIEKLLEQALIHDGEMQYGLYEYELEELLDELKSSLAKDKDDYIFAVTENSGHVAMILIEKSGQVHINEQAREKLRVLWPAAYESNMKKLIPAFAKQLNEGEIPINGVKTVG
jgi:frataxin-like iron-binding protein CyaY